MRRDKSTGSVQSILNVGLLALCLVLLASNLVLLRQAKAVERNNEALRHFALEIKAGARVPPLEGVDLAGNWARIGFDQQKPLLVFVFSPRCAFSDRNWTTWSALSPVPEQRVRVAYVDVSKTADAAYLRAHPTGNALVIAKPDARAITSYNLSMTPQTILVDSQGTVLKVWSGVLTASDVADIRASLGQAR